MKRFIPLIGCLLWTLLVVAAPRTAQQAAEIAGRFAAGTNQPIAQRMQAARRTQSISQPMQLAYTQVQDNQTPALYIFNNEQADGGFVIVSADDNARTILGYADSGTFTEEDIPDNLRFWLQMYAHEIAQAGQAKAQEEVNDSTTYPTIAPLLGKTVWGQGTPFNNLCPTINGTNCVTGCVATAVSQIMYCHKYPKQGTGSHSYTWNNQTLSADFSSTTYDWDNMIPDYNSTYTTTQATAVATLMSHVGIACDMSYDIAANGGSGANGNVMMNALTQYFGYDESIRVLPKDCMDETEMLTIIGQDLQAGHPIFMSGRTTQDEGHAFVPDGMQSNGYVHINWGWNGYYDAYFAISALAPYGQGTGGAASGSAFTERVTAFTGIQPDQGGKAIPLITADSVYYTGSPRIGKAYGYLTFAIYPFMNSGVQTVDGSVTCTLYNTDNSVYTTIQGDFFNLKPGYYYTSPVEESYSLASIPAGRYEVSIGVSTDNGVTIYPILTKAAHGERRFPITVTADSVFMMSEEKYLYTPYNLQGSSNFGSITLSWEAKKSDLFFVYLTWDDNTYSTTTQGTSLTLNASGFDNTLITWQICAINSNYDMLSNFVQGPDVLVEKNPYEPSNLQVATTDSTTYTFTWEATTIAPRYVVYIYDDNDSLYLQDIVQTTHFTHTFTQSGTYSWVVYAATEDGRFMGFKKGNTFEVKVYRISNLSISATSNLRATATWQSEAPKFHVVVTNSTGEEVQNEVVARQQYSFSYSKTGRYTLTVTPLADDETTVLGQPAQKEFSLVRYYNLTISAGTGGTVNEEVNGQYAEGTEVEIVATPSKGYVFNKWNDNNRTARRTITIDQDYDDLRATFTKTYTLTLTAGTGGTVNEEVNGTYRSGEQVEIIATPTAGYAFSRWSDGDKNATRTLDMYDDYELTAFFEALSFTVTIEPAENGKASIATGEHIYPYGAKLPLTPIANAHYIFDYWVVNGEQTTDSLLLITIDQDYVIRPYFKANSTAIDAAEAGLTVRIDRRTIEVSTTAEQKEIRLINAAGQLIGTAHDTDFATFVAPAAGIYIIRTTDRAIKVVVQ